MDTNVWSTRRLRYGSMRRRHPKLWEYVCTFIDQHSIDSVIEVGCGDKPIARDLVHQYIGIDLNNRCDAIHKDFNRMQTKNLPASDLLLACNVIEHISHPETFIRKCLDCPTRWILISFFDQAKLKREKNYIRKTRRGFYRNKYSRQWIDTQLPNIQWIRVEKNTTIAVVER